MWWSSLLLRNAITQFLFSSLGCSTLRLKYDMAYGANQQTCYIPFIWIPSSIFPPKIWLYRQVIFNLPSSASCTNKTIEKSACRRLRCIGMGYVSYGIVGVSLTRWSRLCSPPGDIFKPTQATIMFWEGGKRKVKLEEINIDA